ncbi:hypothetical protein BC830DRAFT_1139612, partial [Chytriomyces sp. MP71]
MGPPSPEPLSASANAASSPEPKPAQTQNSHRPPRRPRVRAAVEEAARLFRFSELWNRVPKLAQVALEGGPNWSVATSSHQINLQPQHPMPSPKHRRKSVAFFLLLDTGISLEAANSFITPATPLPSSMLPIIISPSSSAFPVFRKHTPVCAQLPSSTLDTALTLR